MSVRESDIRSRLMADEEKLSPYATRSSETRGRRVPMNQDPFRLEFARDETRIIHSPPFRRLKHKTQVFLSPDNDHICTRLEHVLHVSSIASIIGRCLGLNTDLINAIAKGHDLGHAPFGHSGERTLDTLARQAGAPHGFVHEVHGLRVVDLLTAYGEGLNLTYEVRDGIVSHCGESFEREVAPDRNRDLTRLEEIADRSVHPATLEGCVVRMVDRFAYLGRDLEDGIKADLVEQTDVPREVSEGLGTDNGKIIGRFVTDAIAHSLDRDAIAIGDEVFGLMNLLKEFNYERIYRHPDVEAEMAKAGHIVSLLFERLSEVYEKTNRGRDSVLVERYIHESPCLAVFFRFSRNTNYDEQTPAWRIVTDYVAGMTDLFALKSHTEMFLPTPLV